MFILLFVILSIISFSLRLGASGLDLASKVSKRMTKISKYDSNRKKVMKGVARVTLATSASFMKLSAFIIARVRDLVGVIGSLVFVIDIIIFSIIVVCASSYLVFFTEYNNDTVVEKSVEDEEGSGEESDSDEDNSEDEDTQENKGSDEDN